MTGLPTIEILGVEVARSEPGAALAEIERLYDDEAPAFVAHANAHTLNLASQDASYRLVLQAANLVLNDGKGVMLAALLKGAPLSADLNGNFFSPKVLELAAARGWPVYFLGAGPGVAARAAEGLTRRIPDLRIAGVRDGFFGAEQEDEVTAEIRRSGAGLLFVGLGNPLQERWLARCLEATGARLGVGVGAFFDFQAGTVQRAPAWMNRLGIEWVHRLLLEPRRMWRRYIVGNPVFIWRVLGEARVRPGSPRSRTGGPA
ncbi:MAG: WecB/TagA/CpsF family glycosyltransferase [Actinobacteria bacterium]|nr:WecB/TagA/CpsF family glycosyltransferase [Actinomycetota bacterium]